MIFNDKYHDTGKGFPLLNKKKALRGLLLITEPKFPTPNSKKAHN